MSNLDHNEKDLTVETVKSSSHREHAEAQTDVVSDPAHADQVGTDWTDEGGATPQGPATTNASAATDYKEDETITAEPQISAVMVNCTLKPSGAASSSDVLGNEVLEELRALGTNASAFRAVDFNIAPGVEIDMGVNDDWPALREKVLDADILVFATPTWLGQHSSVAQRVLERLNADSSETGADGSPVFFGKVAIPVVVGNEDGAHHICAVLTQCLTDVGFSVAAQPSVYWNGEAMHSTDYRELAHTPKSVASAITTAAKNSAHLSRLLTSAPYPR